MENIRLKPLFALLAAAAISLAFAAEAAAEGSPPDFLRWSFQRPERQRDGSGVLVLRLSSSSGAPLSEARWCTKLFPAQSFRAMGKNPPQPIVSCGDFANGERELRLVSGAPAMADIQAEAVSGGRRMYAQTSAMIFGESLGRAEFPVSSASPPPWPDYAVMSSGHLYWPQTGETFSLVPRGPGPRLAFQAYEDGKAAEGVYADGEWGKGFTPGNDPELNRQRSSAFKAIYFVGETPDGAVYSYTLNIHRSRYANLSVTGGFKVFFAAMGAAALIIIVVFRFRRRALRLAPKPL
jgi:hypothetical protein